MAHDHATNSAELSATADSADSADVLAGVGPRLKRIRQQRDCTLAALSEVTGISVSTLSRLESGGRKPTLELLLPIAHAHQVPLDELVGAPPVGDPRVRLRPIKAYDATVLPLSQQPGGVQAFKMIINVTRSTPNPAPTRVTSGSTCSAESSAWSSPTTT